MGAAYEWDYFLHFFTACFCVENDELKAGSYFICAAGEKDASVGLPEVSIYTSILVSLKALHYLAERHPHCFRDGAFGLKRLHIPSEKTGSPGQETKPRVCLKMEVL